MIGLEALLTRNAFLFNYSGLFSELIKWIMLRINSNSSIKIKIF
jgi:hypothetical protein